MADNIPKDDDFEDADFEDLDPIEDEDDLGDESWDVEDSAIDSAADDDVSDTAAVKPARKKTFVQKNFALIVAAVVVVFGGVIGVSLLGGGSPAPSDEQAAAENDSEIVELSDQSALPPMPSPINAETGGATAPDDALTPMPTPQDLQNTELAELEVEEVPAAPAGQTTDPGEPPFDDFAGKEDSINAAERLNLEFRQRAATIPEPVEPEDTNMIASTLESETAQAEPPAEEKLPMPATTLADTPAAAPTIEAPAADLTPQLEAQKTQIEMLEQKLAQAEAEAQKSKAALEKSLQDSLKAKDQEISKLTKTVGDLEQKLAAAKTTKAAPAEAKPAPVPVKEPEPLVMDDEPTATKAPAPVAKAPDVKPKATTPAKAAPVVKGWELKGVSPGKAVLASKATGDIRTVAVGDRVDGLGKITSIAKDNGRWTVRGTSGQVSR